MGKKGFIFLLLLALFLAGVSILLVKKLLDAARVPPPPPPVQVITQTVDMVKVLVAKEDIPLGKPVGATNVDVVDMPKNIVAETALRSPDELVGRFAAQYIPRGDIIMQSKAVPPSQLPRASLIIEPGHRLISVRVDEIRANSFLVKNGDYVDLMGNFNVTDDLVKRGGGKPYAGTLPVIFMQRVKVFDIVSGNDAGGTGPQGKGSDVSAGDRRLAKGTTATFDVTPRDAEIIMAGESKCSGLCLVLRRIDDEVITPPPSDMYRSIIDSLTGQNQVKEEAPPPAPAAPVQRKKVL